MNPFKDWMNNLEFDLSGISFTFETNEPDMIFPGIDFSFDDDWEMERAARFAQLGFDALAEACRVEAGYGGLEWLALNLEP